MSARRKRVTLAGTELPDGTCEKLSHLLLEAVLDKDLAFFSDLDDFSDVKDLDEEQRIAALTKEDLNVPNSLKSPASLDERITAAEGDVAPAERQSEKSTVRDCGETTAEPGSAFHVDRPTKESDQMQNDGETLNSQEQIVFRLPYRKTTELGRGGQGVVHLLEGNDAFAATCAMKIFNPKAYCNADAFVADMQRMHSIAKLLHHNPHDDLVDIYRLVEHDEVYALLMQYINGCDLRQLLQPGLLQCLKRCVNEDRWRTISNVVYSGNRTQQLAVQPAIAVYIIERVLRGVLALHELGIVHGDIKPSNIMLNASGSLKIIDIGSAFEITTPPAEYYVTPAYAAPEFLESGEMTKQSDLASVGYVLIELLSGKSITDAACDPDESTRTIGRLRRKELIRMKKTLPQRLADGLPANVLASDHLVELCRRLIDPDLSRRFLSADECISDRDGGTFQITMDLIRADLGVCNYLEVSRWLADVKQATRSAREAVSLPR